MSAAAPGEEPLAGARVLITAHRRAQELTGALERHGVQVVHAPVLSIRTHVDDVELLARTRALFADPPDVVVVTTGVGFRGWLAAAEAAGLAPELIRVLGGARIVARGPKARGAIQAAGLSADWVAESETGAELVDFLTAEGVADLHIVVQHHGAGATDIDDALRAAGARVTPLVVYAWGPPPDPAAVARGVDLVADGGVDAVVFTSAPGVDAFLEAARAVGRLDQAVAPLRDGRVLAATVGPVTAGPLQAVGVAPLVPDRYRLGATVRRLVVALAQRSPSVCATAAGDLVVDRDGARLAGRPLPLSQSGLAVMRLLADRPGVVVTKDAILKVLPGGSGKAHAAEAAVGRLRDALAPHDLVETVVKRGYRLRMPESPAARSAAGPSAARHS